MQLLGYILEYTSEAKRLRDQLPPDKKVMYAYLDGKIGGLKMAEYLIRTMSDERGE